MGKLTSLSQNNESACKWKLMISSTPLRVNPVGQVKDLAMGQPPRKAGSP